MTTKAEALAAWDVVKGFITGGTAPPATSYPPADCYLNPVPGAGQVPPGFDPGLSQQPEHRWSLPQNSTLCLDTRPGGQVALYTRCAEDGLIPLRNVDGSTNPTSSNANYAAEVARINALLGVTATPPPPPPPPGDSPDGTEIAVGDGKTITAAGVAWTFGAVSPNPPSRHITQNGVDRGGWGTKLNWKAAKMKTLGSDGNWYLWNGSGWAGTTAP